MKGFFISDTVMCKPKSTRPAPMDTPSKPAPLPSKHIQRCMLATAIGKDLDKIAKILGYEPRNYRETDAQMRARMDGAL